jgi:hypothetical protein
MVETKSKVPAKRNKELVISKDQIIEERDIKGLSWRQVAINLNLTTPGAARSAYTKLTGRSHTESVMPEGKRARRGTGFERKRRFAPNWNDDSDQDEIIERLETCHPKPNEPRHCVPGRTIVVTHRPHTISLKKTFEEEVTIHRIIKFTYEGPLEEELVVQVISCEDKSFRSFRVKDIVDIR